MVQHGVGSFVTGHPGTSLGCGRSRAAYAPCGGRPFSSEYSRRAARLCSGARSSHSVRGFGSSTEPDVRKRMVTICCGRTGTRYRPAGAAARGGRPSCQSAQRRYEAGARRSPPSRAARRPPRTGARCPAPRAASLPQPRCRRSPARWPPARTARAPASVPSTRTVKATAPSATSVFTGPGVGGRHARPLAARPEMVARRHRPRRHLARRCNRRLNPGWAVC